MPRVKNMTSCSPETRLQSLQCHHFRVRPLFRRDYYFLPFQPNILHSLPRHFYATTLHLKLIKKRLGILANDVVEASSGFCDAAVWNVFGKIGISLPISHRSSYGFDNGEIRCRYRRLVMSFFISMSFHVHYRSVGIGW